MARTVFFHVGLPKTGTTYLQTLMWAHRDELMGQGVLLPGDSVREHLWASGVVREDPRLDRRTPAAKLSWDRLVEQANEWPDTVVISHEFFSAASRDQVKRALDRLEGATVHVVVTARDTVSLVTARWQEFVKNGRVTAIDRYPRDAPYDPADEWGWGTLDLADVLDRWGATLPPERVHVLPLPGRDDPRDTLWVRFAELVGIDPASVDSSASQQNESLGVVEVELLRRVNRHLVGFTSAVDRGNWIRGYLAQGKLVPRGGDRFWPSPKRVAVLRARGERIVDEVAARGYHVVGDLESLRTPAVLPERRHPDSVTDAELADAGAATVAAMMTDVRRLTRRKRTLEQQVPASTLDALKPALRPAVGRARDVSNRVLRMWRRS